MPAEQVPASPEVRRERLRRREHPGVRAAREVRAQGGGLVEQREAHMHHYKGDLAKAIAAGDEAAEERARCVIERDEAAIEAANERMATMRRIAARAAELAGELAARSRRRPRNRATLTRRPHARRRRSASCGTGRSSGDDGDSGPGGEPGSQGGSR